MRRVLAATLLIAAAPTCVATAAVVEPVRIERSEVHMGTTFRVVVYAGDRSVALAGTRAAFLTVARLDALFSDYRVDSEVALLGGAGEPGEAVPVSDALWEVLTAAQEWSARTGGAFDVTVGPLTRLWRWSVRRGVLPESERLARARAAVGYEHLSLDPVVRAVRLGRPGMALDLGGIAKGYAADAALAALAAHGLHQALVDAGGDVAVGAAPPGAAGWSVELPDGDVLVVAAAAVATSGDRYRYLEVDGVRYAHVVDPRTGLGVREMATVTVVAPDATSADVLASALGVMGVAQGTALVGSVAGADARVRGATSWQSDTFPRLLRRPLQGADR